MRQGLAKDQAEKTIDRSSPVLQLWDNESVQTNQLLKNIIDKTLVGIFFTVITRFILLTKSVFGEVLHQEIPVGSDISRIEKLPLRLPDGKPNDPRILEFSQTIPESKIFSNIEMISSYKITREEISWLTP